MKSQYITIKSLPQYLESAEFQNSDVIPISRLRGYSQARNPRARPDDVALVLLKEDGRLMGYLGLLPDTIVIKNRPMQLAWMSCIWVSPDARGKGVASRLLKEGFEQWGHRLLATEFTAPAKRLYDKLELFDDLHLVQGIRAYLRLNLAVLLPKKNPKYHKYRLLLKLGDGLFNLLNAIRLSFYQNRYSNIRVEPVDAIDDATWAWIKPFQREELFRRSKEDLNWMLKNPWIGNSIEAKADSKKYHFSVFEQQFRFVPLKIAMANTLLGVIILAVRGDALKIPYAWFEAEHSEAITKAIVDFMLNNKLSILTTYHQSLVSSFQKNKAPFFTIRPFKRHYLISKALEWPVQKQPAVIQDGDGDCAFT